MNNENDSGADAWANHQDGSAFNEPKVKEERPPIAESLVCEAAAAGQFNQQMLSKLTGRDWEDCKTAMLAALANGLVENSTGDAVLTEKGQTLLDDARRNEGPMTSRAASRIAKTLDEQDKKQAAGLDKAADEVRGVNDALDRLLEGHAA